MEFEGVIILITVIFGVALGFALLRVIIHGKRRREIYDNLSKLKEENSLLEESNESSQRLISLLKSTI